MWTKRGLVTHYVFFVIHHATRMVEIAGVTPIPGGNFMARVARNLTDSVDGFLHGKQFWRSSFGINDPVAGWETGRLTG